MFVDFVWCIGGIVVSIGYVVLGVVVVGVDVDG